MTELYIVIYMTKNREKITHYNRIISIIVGSILGIGGFFYANHKKHGLYNIGVNKISELIGIIIFQTVAINSNEEASIGLLQMIAMWHLTSLIYYWKQIKWF